MGLGVEVQEQDPLAGSSESGGQIYRCSCFANAAFLIDDCDPSHDRSLVRGQWSVTKNGSIVLTSWGTMLWGILATEHGQPTLNTSLTGLDVADRLAILTLNHPEKRNALSWAVLTQLRDHLAALAGRQDVGVIILRAEGTVFSSGHDLRELADCTAEAATSLFALCTEVMLAIRH